MARGGSLPPIHTGAYVVNDEMIDVLRNRPIGQHASTTAAIIALDMAKRLHIPAYIYDGNTADEMEPVSRISGCPLVPRLTMGISSTPRRWAACTHSGWAGSMRN